MSLQIMIIMNINYHAYHEYNGHHEYNVYYEYHE